ncbi:hypothetical protein AC622_17985 [Bacillus sp. FJAT-27916]|nr:hypothetical protein AC622_17985 [Bacillus sp. FJAT-27916]
MTRLAKIITNPRIAIPGCNAFETAIIKKPIAYKVVIVIAQIIICLNEIKADSEKAFLSLIIFKSLYDSYMAKKNGITVKYKPINIGYFKNAYSGYISAVFPAREGNAKVHKPSVTIEIINNTTFKNVSVLFLTKHLVIFIYIHNIPLFIVYQ